MSVMTQESVEAEFGIDLVDVSEESLMSVLTSSESVLSAAIERILEEGKATSIASAGFQAFHP